MRTFLAGDGEDVCSGVGEGATGCSGEIEGEGDSPKIGEGIGVAGSCAAVIAAKAMQESRMRMLRRCFAMRDLSIVTPVHVRKNIVPPFAVAQKRFVDIVCDKLIVQTIETSKMIDCALSRVFARGPGFH